MVGWEREIEKQGRVLLFGEIAFVGWVALGEGAEERRDLVLEIGMGLLSCHLLLSYSYRFDYLFDKFTIIFVNNTSPSHII